MIEINGEKWKIEKETYIAHILSKLKISPKMCAVELNGEIIQKEFYNNTILNDGDKIEIMHLMGGG